MSLLDSLHDWQNFFVVTGGASASLIGLMFVSLSLGAHLVNAENERSIRTYVNPILLHLGIVLVTSCVMLVPTHTLISLALMLVIIGVVGLREAARVWSGMRREASDAGLEDQHWFWYLLVPLFSYVIACLIALGLLVSDQPVWLDGVAVLALALLVTSIRNMWVLVLWVVQQR
ncbi:MAG TPA: hypothetical protein VHD90_10680 [Phototrophicaceae bacterium]|nr:hypothetical protein [Phototrophicaceae bacterium]